MAIRSIVKSKPLQFTARLYLNPSTLSYPTDDSGFGTPLGWADNTALVFGRTKVIKKNKLTGYTNEVIEVFESFSIVTEQRNFDPDVLLMLYSHNLPFSTRSTKPLVTDNAANSQKILTKETTRKILLAPVEFNVNPGVLIYNALVTTANDTHSIIHQIDEKFDLPIAFEALPDGGSPEKVYSWGLIKDMTL